MTTKYVLILGDMTTHYKVVGPFATAAAVDAYLDEQGAVNNPPNLSWQRCPIEEPVL
jgi:hypothetical protein